MTQNYVLGASCPVSLEKMNESVVRVGAALVIFLALLALLMKNAPLFWFLGVDFAFRAFSLSKYSLVRGLAEYFAKMLQLPKTLVSAAPKKFAAGVGIAFCVLIALALSLGWYPMAYILGGILLICAFLEAFLGYCVGCQVYTWLVLPFLKK